ncbi:MAG: amidohydrolase [Marmoricola sp.]|jgi:predicted amidohydrolase|nr:amidohydrolase [Marmoricola sp.]
MAEVSVAVAQLVVERGRPDVNLQTVTDHLDGAARENVQLIVFPECALTGYMFDSREEVAAAALDLDGPEIAAIIEKCSELAMYVVVGLLERVGEKVYNSAALLGPEGLIGVCRKRHLPQMGADRFTDEPVEQDLRLFDTPIGRIGIMICYEIRFPEVARTMALGGADIIALPTNWPVESAILADQFTRVRAAENMVYLLVSNRCDEERETRFLGCSQIVDVMGEVIAHAGVDAVRISASIDLARARSKHIVLKEDEVQLSPWDDRRPATYRV